MPRLLILPRDRLLHDKFHERALVEFFCTNLREQPHGGGVTNGRLLCMCMANSLTIKRRGFVASQGNITWTSNPQRQEEKQLCCVGKCQYWEFASCGEGLQEVGIASSFNYSSVRPLRRLTILEPCEIDSCLMLHLRCLFLHARHSKSVFVLTGMFCSK